MNNYIDEIVRLTSKGLDKELFVKLIVCNGKNASNFICVVEGKTDKLFYSNVNHPFFKANDIDYIHGHFKLPYGKPLIGKDAVVKSCHYALEHFASKFEKCIFIVDHDYFGLDEYKDKYSRLCLDSITVLPLYSYENYFVLDENLDWIFSHFVALEQREKFRTTFEQFCSMLVEYCKYKAVITKHHNEIHYENQNCDDVIFHFDFFGGKEYDYTMVENEIENMRRFLSNYPELLSSADHFGKKLKSGRRLLKGKVMYNFVRFYLYHNYMTDALNCDSNGYFEVLSNLKVNLDVKLNN